MKLFRCDHCAHTLYFENTVCNSCGRALGYVSGRNALISLDPHAEGGYTSPAFPGERFVYCANAEHGACNWLVPFNPGGDPFCTACSHNELVPPMDDPRSLSRWQVIERAKKRLFYSLLRLKLPLATRNQDPVHGLSFRFPNEDMAPGPVMTGHENGIITIALKEADDAEREYRRTQFNEPYRTLLGHFRHEIGHHYWDILVAGGGMQEPFREMFGDERADYGTALQAYYNSGAPPGWQETHISAYSTAHPWEDFAETWAHYLHIVDTTEMAAAFGVRVDPRVDTEGSLTATMDTDPYRSRTIEAVIDDWVPLASLINNLNRAVGQPDGYPFVLTQPIIAKLGFIHRLVSRIG